MIFTDFHLVIPVAELPYVLYVAAPANNLYFPPVSSREVILAEYVVVYPAVRSAELLDIHIPAMSSLALLFVQVKSD